MAAARYYHRNDRGEPMDFKDRHFLLQLYMLINRKEGQRMVVEKSVQCGLTELFLINVHVEANSGFRCMYVMPLYNLRDRLVQARVKPLHNRVPFYRKKKIEARATEGVNRIGLQSFGGGIINFVGSNVESEFLEMSVDSVYVDEKDRCDQENLKLIPGRLTASRYQYQREISNPTIENFGIDKRYMASSKGLWHVKCEHCNHWTAPDMFKHLVEEIADDEYRVRDPNYKFQEVSPELICDNCAKPFDRLSPGEWVHEFENREYSGFRISQLFYPTIDMGKFLDDEETGWFDAILSETGKMVFYNNRLGLPYDAADAKISEAELNACWERYDYPYKSENGRQVFVGVDVGTQLHVVIRERVTNKGDTRSWLCYALTVRSFEELESYLNQYGHRICVIDALPEGHSVRNLKMTQSKVYSCLFVESALTPQIDKDARVIKINRTMLLDAVKEDVSETRSVLPTDAKRRIPTYYSHLTEPTRIFEINETVPDKSQFKWVSTSPDHYFLAEAYCRAAMLLAPNHDLFDFYEAANEKMRPDPVEDAPDVSREIARMSPQSYLNRMRRKHLEALNKPQ